MPTKTLEARKQRPPWADLVVMAALAFVYHFIWEVAQCQLFFIHIALPPTWGAMVVATLGDVVMTFAAYFVVAIGFKDLHWHQRRPWGMRKIIVLEVFSVGLAVAVERTGLSLGRWAYAANAPNLVWFGVSAIPVLQLMLLFPATFRSAALIRRQQNSD